MELIEKLLIPIIVGGLAGLIGFSFTRKFNWNDSWKYIVAGSAAAVVGVNVGPDDIYEIVAFSILFGVAGMAFIKNRLTFHDIEKNNDERNDWDDIYNEIFQPEEAQKIVELIQKKREK